MERDCGACLGCGTDLIPAIDGDPNGDMDAVCARCRAEESHDYDRAPKAVFDRGGERVRRQRPASTA